MGGGKTAVAASVCVCVCVVWGGVDGGGDWVVGVTVNFKWWLKRVAIRPEESGKGPEESGMGSDKSGMGSEESGMGSEKSEIDRYESVIPAQKNQIRTSDSKATRSRGSKATLSRGKNAFRLSHIKINSYDITGKHR
ncbi:hypothetical protein T492DRAFT_850964 [Pavlovales sp. CCMP2436]|nr:hypothetical protein T492DRAFT_850964 [Pavlovales sp. CCMP2436]